MGTLIKIIDSKTSEAIYRVELKKTIVIQGLEANFSKPAEREIVRLMNEYLELRESAQEESRLARLRKYDAIEVDRVKETPLALRLFTQMIEFQEALFDRLGLVAFPLEDYQDFNR